MFIYYLLYLRTVFGFPWWIIFQARHTLLMNKEKAEFFLPFQGWSGKFRFLIFNQNNLYLNEITLVVTKVTVRMVNSEKNCCLNKTRFWLFFSNPWVFFLSFMDFLVFWFLFLEFRGVFALFLTDLRYFGSFSRILGYFGSEFPVYFIWLVRLPARF